MKTKEKLQKIIFPEGITYDVKKEAFRTMKVNRLFELNVSLQNVSEEDINKQGGIKTTLSSLVGKDRQYSNLLIRDLEKIQDFLAQKAQYLALETRAGS